MLEHQAQRAANAQLRLADAITAFAGSMQFVYIHILVFAVWMLFLEKKPWPTLTLASGADWAGTRTMTTLAGVLVDLSHEIVNGMTTYPGLTVPELRVAVSRANSAERLGSGVSFEIDALTLVGNTGTCLDSPYHFHADRADVAQLPLERLVDVPVVVVRAYGEAEVTVEHLGDPARLWGRAVLVHTGWARRWGTPGYLDLDCPHLTAGAVNVLVDANPALVGIDSLNIDDTTDAARPAHHVLLGADIPIIEHLTNLDLLPDTGARLTALPAPVRGMASFPVRAVAVVPA